MGGVPVLTAASLDAFWLDKTSQAKPSQGGKSSRSAVELGSATAQGDSDLGGNSLLLYTSGVSDNARPWWRRILVGNSRTANVQTYRNVGAYIERRGHS